MKHASKVLGLTGALLAGAATSACQVPAQLDRPLMARDHSAVALRSIQSRVFDTADRAATIQAVIAAMQDLGFVIDKADEATGIVSGTRMDGHVLRLSANVRPRGDSQMVVRLSAQFRQQAGARLVQRTVDEAAPYRRFFVALEQAMFLSAVESDPAAGHSGGDGITPRPTPSAGPGYRSAWPPANASQPVPLRPAPVHDARSMDTRHAVIQWDQRPQPRQLEAPGHAGTVSGHWLPRSGESHRAAAAYPATPARECGIGPNAAFGGACDDELTDDDAPGIVLDE